MKEKYDKRREHKALEIAEKGNIKQEGYHWIVPSQSGNGSYVVTYGIHEEICTCPDFEYRKKPCKNIIAVEFVKYKVMDELGNVTVKKSRRVTYSQNWTSYNIAQNEEGKLFDQLLSDLVGDVDEHEHTKGRGRPKLSIKDELFCSIQKVYSQLSSRRSASLAEFAKSRDQISHKPHFNVSSNVLNREEITPILNDLLSTTALPLKEIETRFATDSSGFRTRNFMQYAEQKY